MEIAVASWSLRDHINRDIPFTEFPKFAKETFGVEYVELSQIHFERYNAAYLDRIKANLDATGVKVINIPIDIGDISNPDSKGWSHDVKVLKLWFDVARYIGSPCVRVNSGQHGSDPKSFKCVVRAYQELAGYGKEIGVILALENHGGISSDLEMIQALFEEVGSDNFRSCPDFGNFQEDKRYEGMRVISKYAFLAHAKTYDFDPDGKFTAFDFASCVNILKEAGFDGVLSVEFEGREDQVQGVRQSIDLIKRSW